MYMQSVYCKSGKILGMEHKTSAMKQRLKLAVLKGDAKTAPISFTRSKRCRKPLRITPKQDSVRLSIGQKKRNA
jgi:hypothetical protein